MSPRPRRYHSATERRTCPALTAAAATGSIIGSAALGARTIRSITPAPARMVCAPSTPLASGSFAAAAVPVATWRPGVIGWPLAQRTASTVRLPAASNRPRTTTGGGGTRPSSGSPTALSGIATPGGTSTWITGPEPSPVLPAVSDHGPATSSPVRGQPPPGRPSMGRGQVPGSAQARNQPATAVTPPPGGVARASWAAATSRTGRPPTLAGNANPFDAATPPRAASSIPRASSTPVASSSTTQDRRGGALSSG